MYTDFMRGFIVAVPVSMALGSLIGRWLLRRSFAIQLEELKRLLKANLEKASSSNV